MGPGQVETVTVEDQGLAVAGRADERCGVFECGGPGFGISQPGRRVGGLGVDLPGPGRDVVEIDAGVSVAHRPQGEADAQPGERLRLRSPVATGHLHEHGRRGDVVAADHASGPVGIETLGRLHRLAPAG